MSDDRFIELRNGPSVPVEAFRLAQDLITTRGLVLRQEGDLLRVSNPDGSRPDLSPEDVEAIRKWKAHLLALIAYAPPSAD